jgi:hypothetical protein
LIFPTFETKEEMAGADENTPLLGASGGARQVLKSSL